MQARPLEIRMYPQDMLKDEQREHGSAEGKLQDIIAALRDMAEPEVPTAPVFRSGRARPDQV